MAPDKESTRKFGTLGGVFTPCTLTILGVIMFLRFGAVVGHAGIFHALLIVAVAKTITTLTALSLSAIATNTRVQGGGAYYLISRSLGIEFGGAIGVVFYLSQAVSVAMYVIGFTEALIAVVPALREDPLMVATVVNGITFVFVYIGAGWTIKVQFLILLVLLAAVGSFVTGSLQTMSWANIEANWGPAYGGVSFLTMFALFFPAATGIMAGANMSGDLKDPARSIPRGTLLSIAFTALIYLGMAVLHGGSGARAELLGEGMVVSDRSAWPLLIVAGVFAATLSSALGSMMGAPRILQALAKDRVFSSLAFFARGSGASKEPRRATILTFLIAEGGILLGDLDTVAPIITMFFMITYGAINLATFVEAVSNNPSYRPTFRYCHWSTSLLGTLGCTAAMILIDPLWAVLSMLAMFALHRFLAWQDLEATWGDVHSGSILERARRNLVVLEQRRYHPKNWRPAVLALGAGKGERLHLAVYSRWLSGPHGLLLLGQVIVGEPETFLERQETHHRVMRKFIADQGLEAFPAVTVSQTLVGGIYSLVQCAGIGALRPNLVVLGWSGDPERRAEIVTALRAVVRMGRSLAMLRIESPEGDPWEAPPGPIDVWWRGQENGVLMLLLAHLMRKTDGWMGRTIRLRRMIENEAGRSDTLLHLQTLEREARIPVMPQVFVGNSLRQALSMHGRDAGLIMLGFEPPEEDDGGAFLDRLEELTKGLPRVVFVRSAGGMSLSE